MPNDLPDWKTCFHYFRIWAKLGYWEQIHHTIRDMACLALGKKASAAAIIYSRSVRTANQPGVGGDDAGKKIAQRKRPILGDTHGNILAVKVMTADVQDRDGTKLFLNVLTVAFEWLMLILADGGYIGKLIGCIAEIPRRRWVKRSDDVEGFKVVPKRCIMERAFGWSIQSRRLVRDYEAKIVRSETMIYLSMSKRMLARISF